MNSSEHNIRAAVAPALSRRGFLGAAAVASLPVTSVAASSPTTVSVDAFLAKALPAERVRYHSNALAEAMAEMHPNENGGWRVHASHDPGAEFVFIVPCLPKQGPSARVLVDDGSPLLADDVTGTTAYADWEASR